MRLNTVILASIFLTVASSAALANYKSAEETGSPVSAFKQTADVQQWPPIDPFNA